MALDFPTSPTLGQSYSPTSGPTYVWDGTVWKVAAPGSSFNRSTFTATAGQTSFTVSYVVGTIDVFRNGVKLVNGIDYTATSGSAVVLTDACTVGDTVETFAYSQIEFANAVKKTGDTMTGDLTVNSVSVSTNTATIGTAAYHVANGNMGVGTSSPSLKLNVKASSGEYRTALFETSSTLGPSVQIKGSRIHELRSTDTGASEGAGLFFIYDKTAEASRLTVDSSGNIGIGTTSPSNKFEVVAGPPNAVLRSTISTSYTSLRLYNDQNSAVRALEIDYSGSSYSGALLSGGPSGESAAITTTGAYPLSFGTNNTTRMTIDSSGRVTMPYQPYAQGSSSNAYTLTSGGFSNGFTVIYNNVDYNVGSYYNSSNGRFTAPVAGYYLVCYSFLISAASSANYDYRLSISINGAQSQTYSGSKYAGYLTLGTSQMVYMAAGDYVTCRYWNDSGTGSIHPDANYNRFSITLMS